MLKISLSKIIIIIIGIQPLGRSGQRPELSGDLYGSGRLHPGQILRGSLPFPSPAFRRSHFRHQVREIPATEGGTVGENIVR
jgi:hypothetical protein